MSQKSIKEILLIEDNPGDAVLVRQVLNECPVPVHLHLLATVSGRCRCWPMLSLNPT